MARGTKIKIENHYARLSLLACVAVAAISVIATCLSTYLSSGRLI